MKSRMKFAASKLRNYERSGVCGPRSIPLFRIAAWTWRLRVLRILGLASVLSLAAEPGAFAADADDPDTELASLKVAEGFEVNLFASERDGIAKPIQIRFDPQGRL